MTSGRLILSEINYFLLSHKGHSGTVCVKVQRVLSWGIVTGFANRFVFVTETQSISCMIGACCFKYNLDEIRGRRPGFVHFV
jgi:hypothetical protein